MSSVIYRPSDSSNHPQQHNRNTGNQDSGSKVLVWIILTGLALYIGYFLLAAAYSAIFIVAASSLATLFGIITGGATVVSLENIVIEGACGAVVGFLVGTVRRIFKIRRRLGESFVSAVIGRRLLSIDNMFIPAVIISTLIGFLVGCAGGAAGTINFIHLISGTFQTFINADIYVLTAIAASGGAGGFGSAGGFGLFLFLLFVILIQAIVAGLLLGIFAYVLTGAVLGMVKGANKGIFSSLVEYHGTQNMPVRMGKVVLRNAFDGAKQGVVAGALVGLIQGAITSGILSDRVTPVAQLKEDKPETSAIMSNMPKSYMPPPTFISPSIIDVSKINLPPDVYIPPPQINLPEVYVPPPVFVPPPQVDVPQINFPPQAVALPIPENVAKPGTSSPPP
jgi:hypothetical protein